MLRGEPGIVLHGAWFSDDARHELRGGRSRRRSGNASDKPPLKPRALDERAEETAGAGEGNLECWCPGVARIHIDDFKAPVRWILTKICMVDGPKPLTESR